MNNLINNMSKEEKENHIIILDNLGALLTQDLYNSTWSMIELVFQFKYH